jgi:hypothetical protein
VRGKVGRDNSVSVSEEEKCKSSVCREAGGMKERGGTEGEEAAAAAEEAAAVDSTGCTGGVEVRWEMKLSSYWLLPLFDCCRHGCTEMAATQSV